MTDMEKRILSLAGRLLQQVSIATKVWLSITLTLLLGLILIATAFQLDQRQLTELQLRALGGAISEQTASSSAALILAGDELSLAITLQQLTSLTQISGAEVVDRKGNSLAQAGHPSELLLEKPILSGQTRLGSVRIYLDPDTNAYSPSLPRTQAMCALTLLLLLISTFFLSRHLNTPLQALLEAAVQLNADQPITPLDPQRHDELGQIARLLNQRFAKPAPEPPAAASGDAQSDPQAPDRSELQITATTEAQQPLTIEVQPDSPDPLADNSTLLPPPQQSVPTAPELGYLLYINHHVGGSDTLTTAERDQLLGRYRKALAQVARLYKGGFDADALGNWYIRFSPLSNDQSHGINALCAAQLFHALYRGINAQAIHSFSPALNMKLVLLCGPAAQFELLAEDALLLSDRIQENDLITHKALYQIQALQERMLGNAKYRKFDDDTYLISALNEEYQTLIDRQAEHFLKQSLSS